MGPPLPDATRGLGAAALYDVASCIRPRRAIVNLTDRGSVYRTSQNPTLKPNLPSKEPGNFILADLLRDIRVLEDD